MLLTPKQVWIWFRKNRLMSTVLKHVLFFLDHSIAHRLKRFRIYRVFDNIPIDSFFQLFFIHDLLMDFPSFLFARCRSLFSLHFCMLDTVNLFDKNQTVHTTNYFNHHFIDENTLHSDTHAHTSMNWRWKMLVVRCWNRRWGKEK